MLTRRDAERGSITAPAFEDVRIAHARHQRGRGLRSDRLDLHEPPRRLTDFGKRADLTVVRRDSCVEVMKLIEQTGQHLARERRQSVLRIFEEAMIAGICGSSYRLRVGRVRGPSTRRCCCDILDFWYARNIAPLPGLDQNKKRLSQQTIKQRVATDAAIRGQAIPAWLARAAEVRLDERKIAMFSSLDGTSGRTDARRPARVSSSGLSAMPIDQRDGCPIKCE